MISKAQKSGMWSVISPEGVYFQDLQQSSNPFKGHAIAAHCPTVYTLRKGGSILHHTAAIRRCAVRVLFHQPAGRGIPVAVVVGQGCEDREDSH